MGFKYINKKKRFFNKIKVVPDVHNGFEYVIFAAWSEGTVYNNEIDFEAYVIKTMLEFNNPAYIQFIGIDKLKKQ